MFADRTTSGTGFSGTRRQNVTTASLLKSTYAQHFDSESVKWFRAIYEGKSGNRSYATLSDVDFLSEMGLLV